jgi:hypothetical protein
MKAFLYAIAIGFVLLVIGVTWRVYIIGPNLRPSYTSTQKFRVSNFSYKYLRTSNAKVYDEYTYKVDITNLDNTATMFFVKVMFYNKDGFEVDNTNDTEQIAGGQTATISNRALVDYPQAKDVVTAKVEVQAYPK